MFQSFISTNNNHGDNALFTTAAIWRFAMGLFALITGSKSAERNRRIFRFWDGRKWKFVDPIRVQIALQTHPVYRADVHPKLAEAGDVEALNIVLDATKSAFGVQSLDESGTGLPIEQLCELMAEFGDWCSRVKKNSKVSLTSEWRSDSMLSMPGEPTTSYMSDCGSTETVPKHDMPIESDAGQARQSVNPKESLAGNGSS